MRRSTRNFPLVILALCLAPCLECQAAIVKDINTLGPRNPSSDPTPAVKFGVNIKKNGKFVSVGKWTYFLASTADTGTELWRTDGTTAGTVRVTDLRPGPLNSSIRDVEPFGNKLFFVSYTPATGAEPFIHDPVAFTTVPLDIVAGTGSSQPQNPVGFAGGVCFQASQNSVYSLWFSDGTPTGTMKLPVPTTLRGMEPFAVFKGELYFRGRDSAGSEPWKTDGTATGTKRLADLAAGVTSSDPSRAVVVGSQMFFVAQDLISGLELFVTDGTSTGTKLVKDLWPGSRGAYPDDMVAFQGKLYFSAYTPGAGRELYWSDGKTVTLIDLAPGTTSSSPSRLTVAGTNLMFRCTAPHPVSKATIHTELWRFDGKKLYAYDINPTGNSDPSYLIASGSSVFFAADFAWRKGALYKATATGVTKLASLGSSQYNPVARYMTRLASGRVVFNAMHPTAASELWSTDGTATGTGLLADIHRPRGTRDSAPIETISVGNKIFFLADDGSHGFELWVSNGTDAGTAMVHDINRGAASCFGSQLFAWGDKLLLAAIGHDPVTKRFIDNELWIVDANTLAVTAVDIRSGGPSNPTGFCLYGGRVFFSARSATGIELWSTDGTRVGTKLFKDINSGASHSYPAYLTVYRGHLYFSANEFKGGTELWRSDGTPSGTRMIVDVYAGGPSSFPSHIAVAGDKLFFAATGNINQGGSVRTKDLWVSDGSPTGTMALQINTLRPADPLPGRFDPVADRLASFTSLGDRLLFTANSPSKGREVYVSDGTVSGTFLIDANKTGSGVIGSAYLRVGDTLAYFVAASRTSDAELFVTNGTLGGSGLVKNIRPSGSSLPRELAVLGDRLYFRADDGVHGPEPWTSDGTASGTVMVQDIYPGTDLNGKPFGGAPSSIQFAGGRAFFAASHPAYGRELWALDLDSYAQTVGSGCSSTRPPRLTMTRPVLGKSTTIYVRHAAKNTTGFFLTGFLGGPPTFVGGHCTFYLNLAQPIVLFPFKPSSTGSWSTRFVVPNSSVLKDIVHPAQAIVGPTNTPPLGMDVSNGLYVNLDDK
jgi:ELWxxDGT repeat protein